MCPRVCFNIVHFRNTKKILENADEADESDEEDAREASIHANNHP